MARKLFDTSTLIAHWHRCSHGVLDKYTRQDAIAWAERLIDFHDTQAIVTPVVIEFLAGTRTGHELHLARVYLSQFDILDAGEIPRRDWEEAKAIAERVPRDGKPRQLGDCLIRAIAKRLAYEVITSDDRFP